MGAELRFWRYFEVEPIGVAYRWDIGCEEKGRIKSDSTFIGLH
jgi:hypothetical protein